MMTQTGDLIVSKLECPICTDIADKPRVCSKCGCVLCLKCYEKTKARKDECTICKDSPYQASAQRFVERECYSASKDLSFFVSNMSNHSQKYIMKELDTVQRLIRRVAEREYITQDNVRITYKGKTFATTIPEHLQKSLREIQLEEGKTMTMIRRMIGGQI